MAYDIIIKIAFGENPNMLDNGEKTADVIDLEATNAINCIRSELPLVFDIVMCAPLPQARKIKTTASRVRDQGWRAVRNAKQQNLDNANVFSNLISENQDENGTISDVVAACEAQGLIIAGSGTTAVTLTYLVWAVLKAKSQLRSSLETEVDILPEDFCDADLEELPILNAVIWETLRLYGAAPGGLPRIVPPGGATLSGYRLPGGVHVCTQAFSIHRDPAIFVDPEK